MMKTERGDIAIRQLGIFRRLMTWVGVIVGVTWLVGCTLPVKNNAREVKSGVVSSVPARPAITGKSAPAIPAEDNHNEREVAMTLPAGAQRQLETCLFEAKQLAGLGGGAYRQQVAELYRHLQAAKYYSSIAGELAGSTTDTITPLYQYKVNDTCNSISQSLLVELKKGIMPGRSIHP